MFSPYYAWARRGGAAADPENHCTLNVVLSGPRASRWAMTERGRPRVARTPERFAIGASAFLWDGAALRIDIDERSLPAWRSLRGRVTVHPEALTSHTEHLDDAGLHRWSPMAPRARVEVELAAPALRWRGMGYLDSNDGDGPLEESFHDWSWSRAALRDGTAILYEANRRRGGGRVLALRIGESGGVDRFEPPPSVALPPTFWRLPRPTRAEAGRARVVRTLLDAPFYARSEIAMRLLGEEAPAMHEALSLDRFRAKWVQAMLPFRMPRL